MQPGPHNDSQCPHGVANCAGTLDGSSGSIEGGQEAITDSVDLSAPEPLKLASDRAVMSVEQVTPAPVAKLRCSFRGADDVSEEDRSQHTVSLRRVAGAREELLDLSHGGGTFADKDHVVFAGKLHELGPLDVLSEIHRLGSSGEPLT